MQKAKRIRTRRVLDVVANDGGHDDDGDGDGVDGVADSLAQAEHRSRLLHPLSLREWV